MKLKLLISILFLTLISFLLYKSLFVNHIFENTQEISYEIDCNFYKVKKIMTRTNVLEAIISREQGEIKEKKWSDMNLSSEGILKGFDIEGNCNLLISKKDSEAGFLLLKLRQNIKINKDKIESNVKLSEPLSFIKNIETKMVMKEGEKNKTIVDCVVSLSYERVVPRYMIKDIQGKVENSVRDTLNNNKETVIDQVNKYKDKRIIIPFDVK